MHKALVILMEYFIEDWSSRAIHRGRVSLVPYTPLAREFDGMMESFIQFIDHQCTEERMTLVAEVAEGQWKDQSIDDWGRAGLRVELIRGDGTSFFSQLEERA